MTMRAMTTPDAAVRTIAATDVAWANPSDTLRSMAALMHANNCGALVVRRRDGALGVVSERDFVRALAEGADPDDVWAADVMSREVLTTSPDEPILSVAAMMQEAHVRHVVLVDNADALAGIVSLRDVVKPLLDEAFASRKASTTA